MSLVSPVLQAGSLLSEPPGKPFPLVADSVLIHLYHCRQWVLAPHFAYNETEASES